MLLDFDFKLNKLDGTAVEDKEDIAKTIASIFSYKTSYIKPLRAYEIAMSLTKDKKVDISIDECNLFLKEIEECNLTNLAKGQLIIFIKKEMLKKD